ncbi:MAG: aminopeptidase P family protein [Bacteroidales bacterium]|nr:aminopeptidase P family protein [Bacteroidales bacterium]
MTSNQNLSDLRKKMSEKGIDAYLIPITDPHMGEYVPARWKTMKWFSGFTGSAGNIVVTKSFAGLWTDSRYFLQAEQQLKGSGIELVKLKIPHTPEYVDWLTENLESGMTLGYDGEMVSIGLSRLLIENLIPKNIVVFSNVNLTGEIWNNQPTLPKEPIFDYLVEFSGISRREKIKMIQEDMKKKGVDFHLLSALDDIAWTFNIRGNDVLYSPLVVSFALISQSESFLFIDHKRIPESLETEFQSNNIIIHSYEGVYDFLSKIDQTKVVYLSPGSINTRLYNSIPSNCEKREGVSIPTMLKSIKNKTEVAHIHKVMVKDGIALTKLFYWLEKNIARQKITEVSLAARLEEFRAEQENFMAPSFATIAGYKGHGAIIHYEATPDTDVELEPTGIFLLDSGGQYLDGTTDTTRTISLGNPTEEEKRDFTLVLKGTIQLAMIEFPEGTKGYQIEAFARRALWDHGLNYGHGTGHGVGFFLNVHEGPQTIGSGASGNRDISLEPGMLISDEPGFYREGKYGLRTENLILVKEKSVTEFGRFRKFETVTLCYIDTNLIDLNLLSEQEKSWLNDYHASVYEKLSPFLSDEINEWLKIKTAEIS